MIKLTCITIFFPTVDVLWERGWIEPTVIPVFIHQIQKKYFRIFVIFQSVRNRKNTHCYVCGTYLLVSKNKIPKFPFLNKNLILE